MIAITIKLFPTHESHKIIYPENKVLFYKKTPLSFKGVIVISLIFQQKTHDDL